MKINNHGAASDAGVVDFILTAPENSYVKLDDGTDAKMDSVIQNGKDTRVAIKPIVKVWNDLSRDDPSGGDATAYVFESGSILWPSGIIEAYSAGVSGASTGWDISNPTKSSWNPNTAKPMEPDADEMIAPGSVMTVSIVVTLGYADWVMPGTWSVQADARSWADYENTFTSGDSDGQATLVISRPDLSIGEDVRYISHATGYGSSNIGWEKKSGGSGDDADPYFSFMFQVINTGTETVGSFFVGLTNVDGDAMADVQVSIYWTGNAWAIDESKTTAHGAKIVQEGNSKFIYFEAIAAELGMTEGPGLDSHASYKFRLSVDTSDDVSESNEGNNIVPITVNAVKEVNTIPSFALSLMSITMSGLLAAIGIALRQKEEE